MDRVSACGAEDTSSIPVGRTFRNHAKAWFFVRTSELVCRSLQYGLGRTFRNHAKAWFFVRTSELVCRSLQYGLGRTFRNHAKAWFFCAHKRTCMPFPTIRPWAHF